MPTESHIITYTLLYYQCYCRFTRSSRPGMKPDRGTNGPAETFNHHVLADVLLLGSAADSLEIGRSSAKIRSIQRLPLKWACMTSMMRGIPT